MAASYRFARPRSKGRRLLRHLDKELRRGSKGRSSVERADVAHPPREWPEHTVAPALKREFPWLGLLPGNAVAQFTTELIQAAQASVELGQRSVLGETLRGWKATAKIYNDPDLLRQLIGPLPGDLEPGKRCSAGE